MPILNDFSSRVRKRFVRVKRHLRFSDSVSAPEIPVIHEAEEPIIDDQEIRQANDRDEEMFLDEEVGSIARESLDISITQSDPALARYRNDDNEPLSSLVIAASSLPMIEAPSHSTPASSSVTETRRQLSSSSPLEREQGQSPLGRSRVRSRASSTTNHSSHQGHREPSLMDASIKKGLENSFTATNHSRPVSAIISPEQDPSASLQLDPEDSLGDLIKSAESNHPPLGSNPRPSFFGSPSPSLDNSSSTGSSYIPNPSTSDLADSILFDLKTHEPEELIDPHFVANSEDSRISHVSPDIH